MRVPAVPLPGGCGCAVAGAACRPGPVVVGAACRPGCAVDPAPGRFGCAVAPVWDWSGSATRLVVRRGAAARAEGTGRAGVTRAFGLPGLPGLPARTWLGARWRTTGGAGSRSWPGCCGLVVPGVYCRCVRTVVRIFLGAVFAAPLPGRSAVWPPWTSRPPVWPPWDTGPAPQAWSPAWATARRPPTPGRCAVAQPAGRGVGKPPRPAGQPLRLPPQ